MEETNKDIIKEELSKGSRVKVISFDIGYTAPINTVNKSRNIVEWGSKTEISEKNLYPEFPLSLYNDGGSPTHKACIDKKIRFGCGNGFKKVKDKKLEEFMKSMKFNRVTKEGFTAYEVFNGFAFEIVWDRAGENWTSFKAIPLQKLRIGIEHAEIPYPHYWFSNNWAEYKKEMYAPELIPAYDSNDKTGKKLYYYSEFNLSNDFGYPTPTYSNSFNFISIEAEFGRFQFNNLANGYAPDFLLNIATGIPGDEEQDAFFDDFKAQMGNRGRANKIIITYSDGADGKSELTTIQGNESDKRFQEPLNSSVEMIARGHNMPPQLVIMSDGLFGQDRDGIMAEFQEDYVASRQQAMEDVLNELLADLGYTEEIRLLTYKGEEEDEVQPEAVDANAEAQANLRGSVGGVQALLQVQQSVSQGLTGMDSALAIVELIYGFEEAEAKRLVGQPKVIEASEPSTDTTTQTNI